MMLTFWKLRFSIPQDIELPSTRTFKYKGSIRVTFHFVRFSLNMCKFPCVFAQKLRFSSSREAIRFYLVTKLTIRGQIRGQIWGQMRVIFDFAGLILEKGKYCLFLAKYLSELVGMNCSLTCLLLRLKSLLHSVQSASTELDGAGLLCSRPLPR